MPKRAEIEGIGVIEIPDTMSEEQFLNSLTADDLADIKRQRVKGVVGAAPGQRGAEVQDIERRLALQQEAGVPVGIGEVANFGARWRLGLPGVTGLEEQKAGLMQAIPGLQEGDVIASRDPQNPSGYSLLVRLPGSSEFVEINTGEVTRGDVAEFLGPQAIGAAVGSAIPGMLGLPGIAGRFAGRQAGVFAGGGAGRAVSEAARPIPRPEEALGNVALGGAEELLFNLPGEAMSGIGRSLLGNFEDIPVEVLARIEELRELGLDIPTLYRSPSGQFLARQAAVTSIPGRERHLDVLTQASDYVHRELAKLSPASTTDEIADVTNRALTRLQGAASQLPRTTRPEQVSEAAVAGLEDFTKARRGLSDRLYTDLRTFVYDKDVRYNVGARKDEMAAIQAGMTAGVVSEAEETAGQIVPQAVTRPNVRARRAMQTFMQLPDELDHFTFSPKGATGGLEVTESSFDQLRSLRHELDASISGHDPQADAMAAQARNLITEILEAPTIRDKSGKFLPRSDYKTALDRANSNYADTIKAFDTIRARGIVKRSLEMTPERTGASLISPDQPDRVGMLKSMMAEGGQPQRWETIRGGYLNHLQNNPAIIEKELAAWDKYPSAKAQLLNPGEEQILKDLAEGTKRLANPALKPFMQRGQQLGRQARDALLSLDADTLHRLVQEAGGKDSPIGHSLQYGLLDSILEASEEKMAGRLVLNPDKAETVGRRITRDEALFDIVGTPELKKVIDNLGDFFSWVPWSADVGSSILGAQIAGARSDVLHPMRVIHAQYQIGRREMIAAMLGSSFATKAINRVRRKIPQRVRQAGPTRIGALLFASGLESLETDVEALTSEQRQRLGVEAAAAPPSTFGIQVTPAETAEALRGRLGF